MLDNEKLEYIEDVELNELIGKEIHDDFYAILKDKNDLVKDKSFELYSNQIAIKFFKVYENYIQWHMLDSTGIGYFHFDKYESFDQAIDEWIKYLVQDVTERFSYNTKIKDPCIYVRLVENPSRIELINKKIMLNMKEAVEKLELLNYEIDDNEPLVFLDLETTGLGLDTNRVVEIAAVQYEDNDPNKGIYRKFHSYVRPAGKKMTAKATEINRITDEMLIDKPLFRDIAQEVSNFVANKQIVAHNANFDLKFLNRELSKARKPLVYQMICTMELSWNRVDTDSYSLENLASLLDIGPDKNQKMHSALVDVEVTAKLFNYLNSIKHINI